MYLDLLSTFHSVSPVKGLTHRFYRYPARFAPQIVREILRLFTKPGDWVCDPFMGGGTAVVEATTGGRRILGIDINSLAVFVTQTKTTPLSPSDKRAISKWTDSFQRDLDQRNARVVDLNDDVIAPHVAAFLGAGMHRLHQLRFPRQQRFVRCALLRTGQWASERGTSWPSLEEVRFFFGSRIYEMFDELDQWVEVCRKAGIPKNQLTSYRMLMNRSCIGIEQEPEMRLLHRRVKLVITSPPYPGVHIVYHRWQVRGRRETASLYEVAGLNDGHTEAYYTLGSRTPTGLQRYFSSIRAAFSGLRRLLHPQAVVAQLIAFSDAEIQHPLYLQAMEEAGYEALELPGVQISPLQRMVPSRRWYAALAGRCDASRELLLLHRPRRD